MDASTPLKMGWNPIDNMCANSTPSLDEEVDNMNSNTGAGTTVVQSNDSDDNKTTLTVTPKEEAAALSRSSAIAPISDLSRPDRIIWVVTTAALPWRTGTSVNPLARALYLTRGRPKHAVTLMIPFLPSKEEQKKVYGDTLFETREEQEAWIRDYCKERVHCGEEAENLRIRFYNATYNKAFGSIFSTVDICALVPDEEADVCILEEPEHMNWMRVVDETEDMSPTQREVAQLGWAVKFKHVVGIIHTNYDAYVRQYGMGAAFLAGSALQALSAMVTRAYCHKVIRLSDALPTLDKPKEVTSNVHGVRSEFLEPPQDCPDNNDTTLASIYFIGKLIWAKGFDKMLDIQELFKKETGEYFPIDIYGSGPDEKSIERAFLGRKGILDKASKEQNVRESTPDRMAAGFFRLNGSLRDQLYGAAETEVHQPIEVVWDEPSPRATGETNELQDSRHRTLPETEFPNPFVILSDLSNEFLGTSFSATKAGAKVGQDIVQIGVHALASEASTASESNNEDASSTTSSSSADADESSSQPREVKPSRKERRKLKFDPPKSRYELRRHPAPACFRGMTDHARLRDLTRHKIFFNPSESEVLCTTSAEALAMGKFVILPKHPSNTFFLQFANCLAYESKIECVEKIKWALNNEPRPLSEEEHFQLTWEGANERLYKFSAMTEAEVKDWKESGRAQGDRDAARLHYETVKRGRGVQKLLHRTIS